jgi:hypothetical protein
LLKKDEEFYIEVIDKATRQHFPSARIDITEMADAIQEVWVKFLESVYKQSINPQEAILEIFKLIRQVKREAIVSNRMQKYAKFALLYAPAHDPAIAERMNEIWERYVTKFLAPRDQAVIRFIQIGVNETEVALKLGLTADNIWKIKQRVIENFKEYIRVNRKRLLFD